MTLGTAIASPNLRCKPPGGLCTLDIRFDVHQAHMHSESLPGIFRLYHQDGTTPKALFPWRVVRMAIYKPLMSEYLFTFHRKFQTIQSTNDPYVPKSPSMANFRPDSPNHTPWVRALIHETDTLKYAKELLVLQPEKCYNLFLIQ
ncbi:hypothetical protein AVEN_146952-1 [Araneus ventricosus]|uniref:Uncharacterized protein n=1 Tax=Araneus ventricosus TaxID=182803 RepID=A0A4Y2QNJ9_ARAVE|nr:hypothetical protein AVEN_146952-1 [Araneus ventricosus]